MNQLNWKSWHNHSQKNLLIEMSEKEQNIRFFVDWKLIYWNENLQKQNTLSWIFK